MSAGRPLPVAHGVHRKHVAACLRPALQELAAVAPEGRVALRLAAALADPLAARLRRRRRAQARRPLVTP